MYTYMCIHIHIYIYIHICERMGGGVDRSRPTVPNSDSELSDRRQTLRVSWLGFPRKEN